ncbi:MAG: nucleotidyltransferase family protein [Bacteriovoracaceae bacterium]|nr:nucleotidyltransferase family protein [Bacteriovoracaceae bacterium]
MDIWPHFRDLTHRDMFVQQHGLAGYFFVTESEARNSYIESLYLQTNLLNGIYMRELDQLLSLSKKLNIQCIPIKGTYLLKTIFQDYGMRKMSDIDILTDQIENLRKVLFDQGYKKVDKTDYKMTLSKMIEGNEVVFELHSRLYRDSTIQPIFESESLSKQEHLYYLIYHLSYQHTFLRLNWFIDIALFIKQNPETLSGLISLAKSRGHLKSFEITFHFLNRFFDTHIGSDTFSMERFYSFDFLLDPQSHKIKYYLLKHLTKKNLLDALKYDFIWLRKYFRKLNHQKSA